MNDPPPSWLHLAIQLNSRIAKWPRSSLKHTGDFLYRDVVKEQVGVFHSLHLQRDISEVEDHRFVLDGRILVDQLFDSQVPFPKRIRKHDTILAAVEVQDDVVIGLAIQLESIGPFTTDQLVTTGVPREGVITSITEKLVPTSSSKKNIVASSTFEDIVTEAGRQIIVPTSTGQQVFAGASV